MAEIFDANIPETMAQQTYQMGDIDTQNVTHNFKDNGRNRVEIDKHINSILGAEYFGKADGFMASKLDMNSIKQEEGFHSNNQQGGLYTNTQGGLYSNTQRGLYSNNQGGLYSNTQGGLYSNKLGGFSENPTPIGSVRGRLDKVINEQLYKEQSKILSSDAGNVLKK